VGNKTITKAEDLKHEVVDVTTYQAKTEEEIHEIIKNLDAQELQQQQALQQAQTLIIKIQGARELALQMLPQKTESK
tara:strand:+ start:236 stop:466 length:231 start_codon:yes stop_codon:yes gene_type:complete